MFKGDVGERFTYTASGTVTNIAARLCDFGSQGEIHLSSSTTELVANHYSIQSPAEVRLKNIQDTFLVYQLLSEHPLGPLFADVSQRAN